MVPSKEEAYKRIADLCERFEEQLLSYKQSAYNETLTRRDFIDPFFKALGWDMNNSNGYAEAYREVIHEDKLKIGSATKAPDYSFRLVGGKRLFFVEAKKPSVAVKDDILPAYQVRRYGWSAKMPISIITDFEEFSVYDCTKKPLPDDKASVSRIRYFTYREYLEEFDFIWDTFSKERVLKGSFDKFVQSDTYKKGTATVDKEFLHSLDQWRTYLATTISLRNKELNEDEINFAVQQTLDRIIFLRIAEDRGVEKYGNLKNAIKSGDYYQNLFAIFREADDKYNSGLFDFKRDRISETLQVDNKVIKTIVNELYYPESPYEFSVLSVEILGSAYEQFLGKQIKIDKAHRARIEEKPEVRKAGGVYYTPQYIVDYIVKNTVGKLTNSPLEGGAGGVTPDEISKLKIVDPACGSGSFLIGAYQYLLDWHKDYYNQLKSSLERGQKNVRNEIIPYQANLKARARELRKKSTLSEVVLWKAIQKKQLGVQFHRQVPIDYFIVDFYCHELKLAIEIDGGIHDHEENLFKDEQRQNKLEDLGVKFLRFRDNEVMNDLDGVLGEIKNAIDTPQPPSRGENIEEAPSRGENIEGVPSGRPSRGNSTEPNTEQKSNQPIVHTQLRSPSPFEGGQGDVKIPRDIKKYLKDKLTPEGNLTAAEKKRILLNNIYGVDIDVNAVEVTKLSLLLKCMEGETQASIEHQMQMFHERVLPSLEDNIKCGNSLIDVDYYDSQLDFGEEKKIKPFNWQKAFPTVFSSPFEGGKGDVGFDVVIGNPPYVVIEGEFRDENILRYFKRKYKSASYKIDLYHLFIEKGIKIINHSGKLGFITPSNYLSNNGLVGLRETILTDTTIEILNNITGKVFSGASVDTVLTILSKTTESSTKSKFIHSEWKNDQLFETSIIEFDQDNFKSNEGNIFISTEAKQKFKAKTFLLGEKYFVKFGMQLRDRKKFIGDVIKNTQKELITNYHRPTYTGKDVEKWKMNYSDLLAYFNKEAKSGGCWDEQIHNAKPKIIVRQIGIVPICAIDEKGFCCLNTVFMIVPKQKSEVNLKFILGILNSKFIGNYWLRNFSDLRKTFPKIKGSYLEKLPMVDINFPNKAQREKHDEIVILVDQLLKLNEEKQQAKLQTEIDRLQTRIDYSEDRINKIVYQLYGLTDEEIKIVEGV